MSTATSPTGKMMPKFLVKPVKDDDFYVEYSTVVDAPVGWGNREYYLSQGVSERGMSRIDEHGTIAQWTYTDNEGVERHPYDYSDQEFYIDAFTWEGVPEEYLEMRSTVRREDLKALILDMDKDGYVPYDHPLIRWESNDG